MKRIGIDRGAAAANRSPIFPGEVRTRKLVADGDAAPVRVTAVTVQAGACNRRRRHPTDQASVVTEGTRIVATEGELPVGPGDVVLIAAGELNWHGAGADEAFTPLSILTPGQSTIEDDETNVLPTTAAGPPSARTTFAGTTARRSSSPSIRHLPPAIRCLPDRCGLPGHMPKLCCPAS